MNKEPYQRMPISIAALYWKGISIRAARAKAISFSVNVAFVDIISLRLTIYIQIKDIIQKSMHALYSTHMAFKVNCMLLLQYLEILSFTCTELITKVLHVFQRSITDSDQNN